MLALLSLPLLVTSLLQLRSYYQTSVEQTITIARIETAAAAGALDSWLEDNPHFAAQADAIPETAARALFSRIFEQAAPSGDAVITVRDARGRLITNPEADAPFPAPGELTAGIQQQRWSDGVMRTTGARRVEPHGWSIVVGVPLAADTPAGATVLTLMAVWAFTLIFTFLLAVWAVGRFTKPLRHLAWSAAALGAGQLEQRAAVETGDEVGMLAESFNEMAGSLQARFDELRTQRAFIEEALDSLPLGVVVLDERLTVLKVNRSFAGYVRRPPQKLTGRGLYEAAAGLSSLHTIVEEVRRTRRPFISYGVPLELSAGEEAGEEAEKFWDVILWPTSKESAERGDLLLILTGVSKRVRAERLANAAFTAERARAAELESVITQMNEGVIIADQNGRYRTNPAAARIIGRVPAADFRESIEHLFADLRLRDMEGRALAPAATPLGRALESGELVSGAQVKLMRADEAERVLAISATPLINEAGRRQGAVAVFRDITEEVRQHEELLNAYDRLREHDRLKSAFVANVSHELRTPLNVVIGLCQVLTRDHEEPLAPQHAETVARMERNARSLMSLVSDLLEYSQLEAGRAALRLEEFEPAQAVADIVAGFAAEARSKGLELRTEIAADLGAVVTDKQKLTQALTNLLSNAVKFTTAGIVRVAAGPLDAERWYVEVSDTGIGITPAALRYIFDEFRQGDERLTRAYGGVGLGLAITRKVVELLDGEITVESNPNEGSRFRIVWPKVARPRTGTGSLVGSHEEQKTEGNDLRASAR